MSATGQPDATANVIAFPRAGGKPAPGQPDGAPSAHPRAILAAVVRAHGPLTITTDQIDASRHDQPFMAFDPATRRWTIDVLPTPDSPRDTTPSC